MVTNTTKKLRQCKDIKSCDNCINYSLKGGCQHPLIESDFVLYRKEDTITEHIHLSNGMDITCGYGGLRFSNFKAIPYKITDDVREVTCPDCLTIINIWKKNGN